jgi:hypothetical protein
VVTVMLVVTTVVGPLPVAGVETQAASAGKPEQVKLTAVAKPVEAMMPTVLVPDSPGLVIVTFVGPDTPANPGWIVNVTGCALLLLLKLGSPA